MCGNTGGPLAVGVECVLYDVFMGRNAGPKRLTLAPCGALWDLTR